jgi:predicted Zn-dependent protease
MMLSRRRSVCLVLGPALIIACLATAQTADYEHARQLLAAGRAGEAAAIYRKLSTSDPDNPDLLLNLAIAEYKARRFREAATSAAAASKLAPEMLPARLFLGASQLELSEFKQAIESLEFVVRADPRERNARLMLGEALIGAGRADAAVAHLVTASEMLPANPRVWYGLARSYEALGEKDRAADALSHLKKLPPSPELHFHMAELHSAALRWREAANEWSAALKLAPDNRRARLGLAWSLFRGRDFEPALATLKPLLAEPSSGEVQFLCGAALLNLGQPRESIAYLRDAVAADPGLLSARAALGQALLQTGEAADAIAYLKAALSTDEDGSLHFQLFRAYQLTGQNAEAQEALGAYRRLRKSATSSH